MNSGSTPLLCSAATVAIFTPPTVTLPPKRASIESAGSPPPAFRRAAKNGGISLPVTIFDFFASAMSTTLDCGVGTDRSGFAQVPAPVALMWASPRWSLCMWLTRITSILPRRGSVPPATVWPGS